MCVVSRWDGESNTDVYENIGLGVTAKGVNWEVVEMCKKWYVLLNGLYT